VYTEDRPGQSIYYQLKLYREEDALAFGQWMYAGVLETERLNRKYEVFRRVAESQPLSTGRPPQLGFAMGPQVPANAVK
jgi:hypothetical protein